MSWFRLAVLYGCTLTTLLFQSSGMADFFVYANSTSNMGGDGIPVQATAGTVIDVAGGANGADFVDSFASASFGQLRAYSEARSIPGSAFFGIFARNTAKFREDFLFESAGLAGTTGTAEVKFTVDGTLAVSRSSSQGYQPGIDSSVSASATYTFTGGTNGPAWTATQGLITAVNAQANGRPEESGTKFLGIEQTFTIPFTFGTTLAGVELSIETFARAIGRPDFASSSLADLSHTANWGGIGEVRDASGNLVTNFTLTSSSGFDFTTSVTAVPEPSSLAMTMIGCSALVVRFRKRFSSKRKCDALSV